MSIIKKITAEQTWPIRQVVMWPDQPLEYVKLNNDDQGTHYGLFMDKELVSIISVFIENNEAQFRKFATLQQHQGKGYGTMLLKHLMSFLDQQNLNRVWCNARIDKTGYYERFGLRETDQTFSKGGIDYVIMEK